MNEFLINLILPDAANIVGFESGEGIHKKIRKNKAERIKAVFLNYSVNIVFSKGDDILFFEV